MIILPQQKLLDLADALTQQHLITPQPKPLKLDSIVPRYKWELMGNAGRLQNGLHAVTKLKRKLKVVE